LTGLAIGNEGGCGADREVAGRVNPGRRCCLCKGVCVWGCTPVEGRVGCSEMPLDVGIHSMLGWTQHHGDLRLLQRGGQELIPYVEGLRHLHFL